MTPQQYLAALRKLGLPPYGQATCAALGLRPRQIARMASGESPVKATVALLLRMYLRHGLVD
jgi:hypothetical protein